MHLYLKKFALFLIFGLIVSCSDFEKLRKNGSDEAKYKAANEYYKNKKFDKAGLLFEELIPILKGSNEQEMATFYQAYCDFETDQFQTASFRFKTFAETFARSNYAEEAVYMSAYSLYKDSPDYNLDQSSSQSAADALQTFVNSYPNSKYREDATKIITELRVKLEKKAFEKAKLYYKTATANLANYKSAVISLVNFEKEFPDSQFLEEAIYLKAASQYYYAFNSFEDKKKERYTDAAKYHSELVDKYPNSKYAKETVKFFEFAYKELDRIATDEAKKKAEEEKAKAGAGKIGTASN